MVLILLWWGDGFLNWNLTKKSGRLACDFLAVLRAFLRRAWKNRAFFDG
jgi:hypothetical protein